MSFAEKQVVKKVIGNMTNVSITPLTTNFYLSNPSNNDDENSSLPMPPTEIPPTPPALKACQAWSYDNSIYTSTIATEVSVTQKPMHTYVY